MYEILKNLGISDNNIILMSANDASFNIRNPYPDYITNTPYNTNNINLNRPYIEIDYQGDEVTPNKFLQILSQKQYSNNHHNQQQQLNLNENSKIFIYITGHGGNEFIKFHDNEELSAQDIALVINNLYSRKLYKEIFIIIDTCQAETLIQYITSPNVITLTSSLKNENSYAYYPHDMINVPIIDRFTFSIYNFVFSYYV